MAIFIRENQRPAQDEPMFVISVAARLVDMHPQTLRYYERAGLIKPQRSRGQIRLYSQTDIDRLRKIARLVDDLGVNLAGVEVILNLTAKLEVMQGILDQNQIPLPGMLNENETLQVSTSSAELEDAEPTPKLKAVRRPRATPTDTDSKPKRSKRNG